MQNKFTKGILERQERELKQQKAAAPQAAPASPIQAPQAQPVAAVAAPQAQPTAAPAAPQAQPITAPAAAEPQSQAASAATTAPQAQPAASASVAAPQAQPASSVAPAAPAAQPQRPPRAQQPAEAEPAEDLAAYIVRDNGRKAKNKTFYLDGAVIQAVRRAAAAQHVAESKLVNDILKKILLPEGPDKR